MAFKIKSKKLKEKAPSKLRGRKMGSYPMIPVSEVKSKGEARTMAVDYQNWASNQNMSYGELVVYQNYFDKLGKKFGLKKEFKENGI